MKSFLVRVSLSLAVICAPAVLAAQNADSVASPLVAAAPTTLNAALSSNGQPQKTFFTRRDLGYAAVALVGTGVISIFDPRIARYTQHADIQGGTSRHNLVHNLTKVNETTLTAAALLTYGAGRLTGHSTVADVGLHTMESVVLTSVISQAIRGPLGRTRPSVNINDQYHFQPFKGFSNFDNRSFPSLHSATAFAAAASLVGEIHNRNPDASWIAAPLLYGAAAVPGLTRMYLNQHWASDVVAGAFVGTLIGSRVVSYAHSHNKSKLDKFLLGSSIGPNGTGGMAVSVNLAR
jgi:hypothetical protein